MTVVSSISQAAVTIELPADNAIPPAAPPPIGSAPAQVLPPAIAASLLTHGLIVFALLALWAPGKRFAGGEPTYLNVQLVDAQPNRPVEPPLAAPAKDVAAAPEPLLTAPDRTTIPVEGTRPPAAVESKPAAPARKLTEAATFNLGDVDIVEVYGALASFPDELIGRTRSTYPIEVDMAVQVVARPTVAYPPAALEAQRQGRVVAWLAIGADGAIEEAIIVDGPEEFADAVLAGLPAGKFLPARNHGQAIPFYTILNFHFSGNATNASMTTPPTAGVPAP